MMDRPSRCFMLLPHWPHRTRSGIWQLGSGLRPAPPLGARWHSCTHLARYHHLPQPGCLCSIVHLKTRGALNASNAHFDLIRLLCKFWWLFIHAVREAVSARGNYVLVPVSSSISAIPPTGSIAGGTARMIIPLRGEEQT